MTDRGDRATFDELLEELIRVAEGVATNRSSIEDYDRVALALRESASAVGDEEAWETSESATATVGSNLRRLRMAANWTQQQLATAMTEIGFAWTQVTVAQTEGGQRRRASFEELFGLAALFGRPLAEFLIPDRHGVDLNDQLEVSSVDARELVLGRDGRVGDSGPRWRVAARLCSEATQRPAGALARNEDKET